MIELSGVRSSWLMLARNWLFTRSASRIWRLASASRAGALIEVLGEPDQLLQLEALVLPQLLEGQLALLQTAHPAQEENEAPYRKPMWEAASRRLPGSWI